MLPILSIVALFIFIRLMIKLLIKLCNCYKVKNRKSLNKTNFIMHKLLEYFGINFYMKLAVYALRFVMIIALSEVYVAEFGKKSTTFSYIIAVAITVSILAFIALIMIYHYYWVDFMLFDSTLYFGQLFVGLKEGAISKLMMVWYMFYCVIFAVFIECFQFLFPVSRVILIIVVQICCVLYLGYDKPFK